MTAPQPALEAYLAHLPEHLEARLVEGRSPAAGRGVDVAVAMRGQRKPLPVILMRSNLTSASVAGLIAKAAGAGAPRTLVLAPHVSRAVGQLLRERGVLYLDRAGNCFLRLDNGTEILREGLRPEPVHHEPRSLQGPALRVVFTLLARPALAEAPIRSLADVAGVPKTTVARALDELAKRGFIVGRGSRRRLVDTTRLRDTWIAAYAISLRPKLLLGRFRCADADLREVERKVESFFAASPGLSWGWGGGSGADRLTSYYHGPLVTLHVDELPRELLRALPAAPARDGELIVLSGIGQESWDGTKPRVVHPLLVLAELRASDDPRAHEAADEVEALLPDQA